MPNMKRFVILSGYFSEMSMSSYGRTRCAVSGADLDAGAAESSFGESSITLVTSYHFGLLSS